MSEAIRDAVAKGIAFIEANLLREIGVSDVAGAVNYSQFYFSREFTRHTHISVYDYILRRKLSESYKELFGKRCKIVDLACRYGFQSHEVYTRAFRKLFGENPSEATVYKPLAVYEAIDEAYLDFLSGLRTDALDDTVPDCRFEVAGASSELQATENRGVLILLAPDNPYQCSCVLRGEFRGDDRRTLIFHFSNLRRKLRIHHTDAKSAFRYYADNFHDGSMQGGNFMILKPEKTHIDFLLPETNGQGFDFPLNQW